MEILRPPADRNVLKKVLIANRGEIALRVIRACRELGINSVAVYSDADARAVHVREADEAVHIGGSPSSESYLVGERIIEAARSTGADAIHPGYGFLSEREDFARAVRDAGMVFVGPPAEAIAAMGNKTAARQLAISTGTMVVPGTTQPLKNAAEAERVAAEFGYPVLLKAAAGGGGKGMRVVREAAELRSALDAARREAKGAFGDDAVYVEKYVVRPRHVEIQVLADAHGNIVHLGERDCSVQRRHQKMIEEAPSIAVDASLRARMGAAAVAAARAAGYVNAGTCEFLVAADGNFYFLEMNTRIQVEHPVTELVTGVDLVQWQLRVAGGDRLAFRQEDIEHRGWAIECRITSEDADDGFLPSTGTVSYMHVPAGPGIRWDGGIEPGSEVGLFYDPMVGKLIVWAPTRIEAVARMHRALLELSVTGIETSRNFHLRVMENDDFRRGNIDIQWLERVLPALADAPVPVETTRIAAIAAALMAERDRSAPRPLPAGPSGSSGSEWLGVGRLEALR